jgi:hypothetical protein
VAEGVNGDNDPTRAARAEQCLRAEFSPTAVLVFNGLTLTGINAIVGTFTRNGLAAQQFDSSIFDVHTIVDRGFLPRSSLRPRARISLRVNVVTTFRNVVPNSPALPLPLGEFTVPFVEEFTLEEATAGNWHAVRVEASPLAVIPIPANSIFQPFPVIPAVLR